MNRESLVLRTEADSLLVTMLELADEYRRVSKLAKALMLEAKGDPICRMQVIPTIHEFVAQTQAMRNEAEALLLEARRCIKQAQAIDAGQLEGPTLGNA